MSALDLDPIKARAAAASPGPWADGAVELDLPGFTMSPRTCAGCGADWPLDAPDAEFIAHSREDVPALVAEVERLRAENRALTGILADVKAWRELNPHGDAPAISDWSDLDRRLRGALWGGVVIG